jgi:hypothetical protein
MSISYSAFEAMYQGGDEDTAHVFRSSVDARVWMCNIPIVDVATGLQGSTSIRRIKAYVEEIHGSGGTWTQTDSENWQYEVTADA